MAARDRARHGSSSGRKLPHVFRTDSRKRPDLAGHSRTTTKGLYLANAEVRGPFRWVAGAGFEPA